MKKNIITLSGIPGSGKSSTGRLLAKKLGFTLFTSGEFIRQIGQKRELTPDEVTEAVELDPTFTAEIDVRIQNIAVNNDAFIMDSRIAYHWIPDSFKVYLTIDPTIAVERIAAQIAKNTGQAQGAGGSLEDIRSKLAAHSEREKAKYLSLYKLDYTNTAQYDLVIDSGVHEYDDRVQMIADAFAVWLKK